MDVQGFRLRACDLARRRRARWNDSRHYDCRVFRFAQTARRRRTNLGAGGSPNFAGSSLVSLEIALAVLLLTGAALLIRSFRIVIGRDIGFDTNVATAGGAADGTYRMGRIRATIRRSGISRSD